MAEAADAEQISLHAAIREFRHYIDGAGGLEITGAGVTYITAMFAAWEAEALRLARLAGEEPAAPTVPFEPDLTNVVFLQRERPL